MADTALDIITGALLDLGVLADEETPTASQAVGGLRKLNNLLDSWNIDNLMVFGSYSQTLPLVSGQQSYTIGPGGNLDIPRPNGILGAYLRNPSLPAQQRYDFPIYMMTPGEYADVGFKFQQSTLPRAVYFDQTNPLITAYFYPVPVDATYSLVFWESGIISNLTLYQDVILPPGYKRALEANLTIELAPSYGAQVSEVTVEIARSSKADIKLQNFTLETIQLDPFLTTGLYFNIQTGRYE